MRHKLCYRPAFYIFIFTIGMVLWFSHFSYAQEEIRLSTYYPAPLGEYDDLSANSMAVGSGYDIPANDGDLVIEGNVGIGTTTPTFGPNGGYGLHIDGSSPISSVIRISGANTRSHGIHFVTTGTNEGFALAYKEDTSAAGINIFYIDAGTGVGSAHSPGVSDRLLTIQDTGNVGIGTTPPRETLHIVGGQIIENPGSPRIAFVDTNLGAVDVAPAWYVDNTNDIFRIYRQPNIFTAGTSHLWIDNTGVVHIPDLAAGSTGAKTFVIENPIDKSKYLVHGTLEGPEAGVYYRGTASLQDGMANVILPSYFEALTRDEGRTIQITNIGGFDRLSIKEIDGEKIKDGKFTVIAYNLESNQKFDWEVKATRADIPPVMVEPNKDDAEIKGDGPYTYLAEKQRL